MHSNTEFEALARELRAVRQATAGTAGGETESVLVARLLHGFSLDQWREFRRIYPVGQWCALSAASVALPDFASDSAVEHAPGRMADALAAELFSGQITRELTRLSRTGGDLALICASLRHRDELLLNLGPQKFERLEILLTDSLRGSLEACDSLGRTGQGQYALLPGVGMLRARLLAERMQSSFAVNAAAVCGAGAVVPVCALGIACTDSGHMLEAGALLRNVREALQTALEQPAGHIFLADSATLDQRATLVHSSEKRFLFFGGNI